MKHINDIPAVIRYKGILCEVTGFSEGSKVLFFKEVAKPCEKCGGVKEYAQVESSPNFQDHAEPVSTLYP